MQGLGDFPGGANFSSAISTSRDGSVIVGASDSDQGEQSFRWTSATGLVRLVPPSPYNNGIAFGVSRDGSVVVGENFIGGVSGTQPYRWTAATGEVPLDVLAGYTTARPTAISGNGNVVVGITANADNTSHIAFRWTVADGMQALPIPAGSSAEAQVISADGRVIAGHIFNVGLAIWHDDGTYETVAGLGSSAAVDAGGITADGSIIVGNIPILATSGPTHAFIWDSADGMRDLNFVLPEDYGIDLQGWILNSADGISEDGRVIAGYGTDPQGQMEAWVVVLPEPSVGLLVLSGGLLLRRRGEMRWNWA